MARNTIEHIAFEHGFDSQSIVCMEECAELIKAISKYKRKPCDKRWNNLIYELADVEIMVEQMVYLLDADLIFEQAIREKVTRELKRIEEAKNGS